MPSAHSATVSALAGSIFFMCGPDSPEFAIALIMAIIVMHDASGVRLETGKQAKLLNEMINEFILLGSKEVNAEDKLKEFVGHTKIQVFMGCLLGILISILLSR